MADGSQVFGFGSGFLTGVRNDTSGNTPRRLATLQDITLEWSGEMKELFGQYQYPVDIARGKTKITGKAKHAGMQAEAWNDLFFGQTLTPGQLKFVQNESTTLGTGAASYTVAHASSPMTDQGVFYASDFTQLTSVPTSAPSASSTYNFNPSSGVYKFSSPDALAAVLVNYTYQTNTGQEISISQLPMGSTPTFAATFEQQFENQQIVLVLNRCVGTRVSLPTRIDDYTIPDFEFGAFSDAAGNIGTLSLKT